MPSYLRAFFFLFVLIIVSIQTFAGELPSDGEYFPGVVYIKLSPEWYVDTRNETVNRLGIEHIDSYMDDISADSIKRAYPFCLPPVKNGTDLSSIYLIYFPESISVKSVCNDFERLTGVVYSEPKYIHHIDPAPNDPRRNQQYGLDLCEANLAYGITTGDSRVVIGIVDTGVERYHPDLAANTWINPGEDLDRNGSISDFERNDHDDDNNGKVDDFYGWDFPSNDNDPDDVMWHGSHCAGIASAVTNNGEGVASVGYSCSIMAVRVGSAASITHGYEGIEYAVRAGADVISNSWGGGARSDQEQDVIFYAAENDVVVFAAAGNTGSSQRHYPAAYDSITAVAATDDEDVKADFSTYGNWVDISAPGVQVLSTVRNGGYSRENGTSMACPFAAGVALLIRAAYPDLSREEVLHLLFDGADNIDFLNDRFEGQLGVGRINAFQSLVNGDAPRLSVGVLEITHDDNGNNHLESGETISLVASIMNRDGGTQTESLTASISSDDSLVTIISEFAELENINADEETSNADNPFIVEIAEHVEAHNIKFTLTVNAQPVGIEIEKEFKIPVGHADVLLVDGDGGTEIDTFYTNSLDDEGYSWLIWDTSNPYKIGSQAMLEFPLIIWITGNTYKPAGDAERERMLTALEGGTDMWLISNRIGDDEANREMLETWFGAHHEEDSVGARIAYGLPETPVAMVDSMVLEGADGSGLGKLSPTSIVPVEDADSLFYYKIREQHDWSSGCGGVYRIHPETGAYLMYLGFAFDGVSTGQWFATRQDVFRLILDWFALNDNAVPNDLYLPVPSSYAICSAYPNPFNGKVRIEFQLPVSSEYLLSIFDLTGREIRTISEGIGNAGLNTVVWNAIDMPSGSYVIRLSTPGRESIERQIVLLK
ncbi:S8 family serine peptidase [bacterium]|nr:S8 family serine peptidase [bacterium]